MLSNGRCIGSAGRLSGADMENAYSGMYQQWADKTGVLPAAWDFREKLLLLAPETPQSDGRSMWTEFLWPGRRRSGRDREWS